MRDAFFRVGNEIVHLVSGLDKWKDATENMGLRRYEEAGKRNSMKESSVIS